MMLLEPADIDKLFGISKVVFFKNGLVVERKARFPMAKPPPTERRGIFEMSKKSKLRLTHIVANCNVKFSSMFTLTYGDFFIPLSGQELKRQCNIFLKHFRKRYKPEYIWFLEFTKRDRPHLHVLSTVEPNRFDKAWLGKIWSKISVYDYASRLLNRDKPEDERITINWDKWTVLDEMGKVERVHSHPNCWEKIRKPDGATRYCLKYALKSEQKLVPIGFSNVGRFWGTSYGLTPKPLGELIIGETMTEEQVKAIFLDTRIGQYPLIPRYIFENDAMSYFTSRGLLLTELFDANGNHRAVKVDDDVID